MTDSSARTAASRSRDEGRLRYVDALRGIAALLVVWLHVANIYRSLSPATAAHVHWLNDFVSTIDIGRVGVVVFFLISGFVVPFSIRPDSGAPVLGFAVRRVLRIYPAYWLSVPLAALVFYWLKGIPFTTQDFGVNLLLLQDVFGKPPAEGVYWTLLVELVFYAICIALLLSRSLFSTRRIVLLSALLALAHTGAMFLQWLRTPVMSVVAAFWLLNLSIMLWGTAYRLDAIAQRQDRFAASLLRALGAFYLLVLPVAATLAIRVPNYTIAYALGFAIFIAGTRFVRIETRLTDWLGRISYSIYLFHAVVFEAIYLILLRQPVDSVWRTQHLAVYLLINVLATLAIAAIVFRCVEKPAIRLGHRLAARIEDRAARTPLRPGTHAQGAAPGTPAEAAVG